MADIRRRRHALAGPPRLTPPEANDAAAHLKRIEQLWQELERTHRHTPKYDALIDQIRAETDAFRKIVDAKEGLGSKDPKD
jgi:hypothetical protein